uniref:MENTAL domain-containing protein n=1 Tax=Arion vulgaris TaxID=1028688 RepID=A0A0B6ZPN4_9EUPU
MTARRIGAAPPIMSVNTEDVDFSLTRQELATQAGQIIYKGVHHETDNLVPPPLSNSDRSEAAHPLRTDSTLEVSSMAEGKMSSVRRTFCLFVLFDLILMFILWVIYTQLIGEKNFTAFVDQVVKYTFEKSLFDTVMLSAVRFTLLILAYGLFRIRHWWMIAICTALTCAVLLTKIFLFDFGGTKSSNNPLSYCLIIISFVLAWAETWFLDFKVLPQEKKLRERIANSLGRAYGSTLIRTSHQISRPEDLQSIITEDNQFYSPVDSPEGSDTEQETRSARSSSTFTRQASRTSLNSFALEVVGI